MLSRPASALRIVWLALAVGATLAGASTAAAEPASDAPAFDRSGFVFGLRGGVLGAGVFASDEVLTMLSPSRQGSTPASVFALGIPVGLELGWAITPDVVLTWDCVVAKLLLNGDVFARPTLTADVQVAPGLFVRGGVGLSAIEAAVPWTAHRSAGPERQVTVHGSETIQGTTVSLVAGLAWELPLTRWLALSCRFDAVFSLISVADAPEDRLEDAMSEGAEATVGVRAYW